jgi:hypothetical protein
MVRSLCSALFILAVTAAPARAAWLHCVATGSDANGAFAYATTAVDVGVLKPPRMAQYKQLLAAHIAKADTDARATQLQCFAFDDQLAAEAHYSHTLNATALKLGWEHIVVVPPEAWLTDADIVDEPSRD